MHRAIGANLRRRLSQAPVPNDSFEARRGVAKQASIAVILPARRDAQIPALVVQRVRVAVFSLARVAARQRLRSESM
jgi:hypothetical protein